MGGFNSQNQISAGSTAHDLQDENLLAKLSAGDMTALESIVRDV